VENEVHIRKILGKIVDIKAQKKAKKKKHRLEFHDIREELAD